MTRGFRYTAALLVLAAAGTAAWAANGDAAPAKIEPVLDHVPADAMGFVIINDIRASSVKVDALLEEIGLGEQIKKVAPGGILSLLTKQFQLGYGFQPDGGFAMVMLDPRKHGVDLMKIMGLEPAPADGNRTDANRPRRGVVETKVMSAPGPGGPGMAPQAPPAPAAAAAAAPVAAPAANADADKLPLVILLPGKGVREVFGAYEIEEAGKYLSVKLPPGPMLATKLGGYVALSPSASALDDITQAKTQIAKGLTPEQLQVLKGSLLAAHVNMPIAAPTLQALLKKADYELGDKMGGMGMFFLLGMMSYGGAPMYVVPQFAFYQYAFGEMDGLTIAPRLEKGSVEVDVLAAWKPGSLFAKAYASQAKPPASLISMLPDQNCFFALGAAPERGAAGIELEHKRTDSFANSPMFGERSAKWKARFQQVGYAVAEDVQRYEVALGGGSEAGGVVSAAVVLHGKDSARLADRLADMFQIVLDGFTEATAYGDEEEEQETFTLVREKPDRTLAGMKIETLTISHPRLAEMPEEVGEVVKNVLGEKTLTWRMAALDGKTLLATFGGTDEFFAKALAAAKANADAVGKDPNTAAAIRRLPGLATTLLLINPGNVYKFIVDFMSRDVGEDVEMPLTVNTKTPLAYASRTIGRQKHGVAYVPNAIIKEVVGIYLQMTSMYRTFEGPNGPDGPGPVPGGEDF